MAMCIYDWPAALLQALPKPASESTMQNNQLSTTALFEIKLCAQALLEAPLGPSFLLLACSKKLNQPLQILQPKVPDMEKVAALCA